MPRFGGRPRLLRKVEVCRQIAKRGERLSHRRPWIGAPVAARIKPGTAEKVVLDELGVRVEAQDLVVDEPATRVRTDDQPGDAQSVAVLIDPRRDDMVVEPAPVVPGQDERGGGRGCSDSWRGSARYTPPTIQRPRRGVTASSNRGWARRDGPGAHSCRRRTSTAGSRGDRDSP